MSRRVIAVTTYFEVPEPPGKDASIGEQVRYDALEKFNRPIVKTLAKLSQAAVHEAVKLHFPTMDIQTVASECYHCIGSVVGPDNIFYPIKEIAYGDQN